MRGDDQEGVEEKWLLGLDSTMLITPPAAELLLKGFSGVPPAFSDRDWDRGVRPE